MIRRPARFSSVEKLLRIFTDVRPGEGMTALVLMLGIFFILGGYYLIKPAREGWLSVSAIAGLSKLEVKAYSSFGQSLALMLVVPLYAWLATRLPRRALINRVSLFLTLNLPLFWWMRPGPGDVPRVPYAGVAFYLWVGVFSVTMVAQFWIFAADLYSDKRGRRIFPLIAIGGSSGSVMGAWVAERLIESGRVQTYDLLLIATLPIALSLVLLWIAERRGVLGRGSPPDAIESPAATDTNGASPFALIFSNRYLLAVALFGLLVNWVNTNGENILYGMVQQSIERDVLETGIQDPGLIRDAVKDGTTAFYGNLYFWVNSLALVLQALFVSRVLKFGGIAALLFLTPFVSLLSYSLMALFPVLLVIKVMKIAENSTNYSANNTAKQVLWLPTSQAMLYKAKSTVDTLFVRVGDGLAALTVFVGVSLMDLRLPVFLVFNVALVVVWGGVAWVIVRENRKLRAAGEDAPSPEAAR